MELEEFLESHSNLTPEEIKDQVEAYIKTEKPDQDIIEYLNDYVDTLLELDKQELTDVSFLKNNRIILPGSLVKLKIGAYNALIVNVHQINNSLFYEAYLADSFLGAATKEDAIIKFPHFFSKYVVYRSQFIMLSKNDIQYVLDQRDMAVPIKWQIGENEVLEGDDEAISSFHEEFHFFTQEFILNTLDEQDETPILNISDEFASRLLSVTQQMSVSKQSLASLAAKSANNITSLWTKFPSELATIGFVKDSDTHLRFLIVEQNQFGKSLKSLRIGTQTTTWFESDQPMIIAETPTFCLPLINKPILNDDDILYLSVEFESGVRIDGSWTKQ